MTLEGLKELLEALKDNSSEIAKHFGEKGDYEFANKMKNEANCYIDVIRYIENEEFYQKTRKIFKLGEDK